MENVVFRLALLSSLVQCSLQMAFLETCYETWRLSPATETAGCRTAEEEATYLVNPIGQHVCLHAEFLGHPVAILPLQALTGTAGQPA
eukprot:scaffold2009_cov370-Prasinococcus_capsulatus_cf.AAC.11